ncbi:TolC family outer membrane protein [Tepidamorphus sp. 3E244]|uniref:TolC family outer membrane protein n=1 Tax=Tepidamorphus sp. 3E244 TaxID=3385498 RepID=UPI0038FC4500
MAVARVACALVSASLFIALAPATSTPALSMSLKEAVSQAVMTHPTVNAARAGRRASGYELKVSQGALYPTVGLSADAGQQYVDRPNSLDAEDNQKWRPRRQATLSVRQVLFNGHQRANEIYRAAAVLDSAAIRVLSTAELLALDAVEAYIDYRRHAMLLALARANVDRHIEIRGLVQELVSGGKAPDSDGNQAIERVAAANAVRAQVEKAFLDARAKFKRVIGIHPGRTSPVPFPANLPPSARVAVEIGVSNNPAIEAARIRAEATQFELEKAKGTMLPTIALEGLATYGENVNGIDGRNLDVTGQVTLNWSIFDGHIRRNRERALSERVTQHQLEADARTREIAEAIERAFAGYVTGGTRVASLQEQVQANNRTVTAYREEYQLGKRSLLDLLDGENSRFNAEFQYQSAAAVRYFAAYQLLAHMGRLLSTLGVAPPPEALADHLQQSRESLFHINIEPLRQ